MQVRSRTNVAQHVSVAVGASTLHVHLHYARGSESHGSPLSSELQPCHGGERERETERERQRERERERLFIIITHCLHSMAIRVTEFVGLSDEAVVPIITIHSKNGERERGVEER